MESNFLDSSVQIKLQDFSKEELINLIVYTHEKNITIEQSINELLEMDAINKHQTFDPGSTKKITQIW